MGSQQSGHAGSQGDLEGTKSGAPQGFASGDERLAAAATFLYRNARLIDRIIFAHVHGGASAQHVLGALSGYRNPDGGFGHALEPDVRAPGSQPLQTLTALELLREAGIRAPEVADGCCAFLESVSDGEGAVPALLPGALDYPAADHWQGAFALAPTFSWTIGLVAELVWHGARHPWLDRATQACLSVIDAELTEEAHHLLYLVQFAGSVLEGESRQALLRRCREALSRSAMFVAETPVRRYGLTPLHYAPAPDAPMRGLFDDALVNAHLDELMNAQQADGGWWIGFTPASPAAVLEWRGRWTLQALATLRAYQRIG